MRSRYVIKLLCVLAQCGIASKRAEMLLHTSDTNRKAMIKQMEEKGWIKKGEAEYHYYYYFPKEGTYVWRKKKEKRHALYHVEARYSEYKDCFKSDVKEMAKRSALRLQSQNENTQKRALRQSEILAMMLEANVGFSALNESRLKAEYGGEEKPFYVEARELKEKMTATENGRIGFSGLGSRAYGSMVARGEVYTIYDIENHDFMRFTPSYEQSYKALEQRAFGVEVVNKRIFFCNSYDKLEKILFKSITPITEMRKKVEERGKERLLGSNQYRESFLIAKSHEGQKIVELLAATTQDDWMEYLNLSNKKQETAYPIFCSGWEKCGNTYIYSYNFLTQDLEGLYEFLIQVDALNRFSHGNIIDRYVIHCFSEVGEVLEKMDTHCKIVVHDVEDAYIALL